MQIFYKTLTGATNTLNVNSTDLVDDVKYQIQARDGIACDQQVLFLNGQPLEDGNCLSGYDLQEESTIQLTLRLLGGAKKRKKKNYTTPKKNKHKKKKVKLAVLKFYKVDDNGKITRLRRECENLECGAGVFMANHFDRQNCGRCGVTLVYKSEDK